MRLSFVPLFGFALLAVLMAGCGSSVPVSPSLVPDVTPAPAPTSTPTIAVPTPTASPSPSPTPLSPARTVTSDDGMLTVDIPAGALPIDIDLTATAQGSEDLPPELFGLDVRSAFYRLEPDGTAFASPVTITRRVALEDLGLDLEEDGVPVLGFALRSAGGSWEWLEDQRVTLDGALVVVSGTARHASQVFAFGGTTYTKFSLDERGPISVGSSVTLTATIVFPDDAADPPTLGDEVEPILGSDILAFGAGSGPDGGSLSQEFRCVSDGTTFAGVRYAVLNVGAESALFGRLGLGPISVEVTLGAAVTCLADAPPSPKPTPSASELLFVPHEVKANQGPFVCC